jgi:RNA polymerase sigma factor (sigma-70 family)
VPSEICARPLSRGYQREDSVEREINSLLRLDSSDRKRRILRPPANDEPASPECTLYVIRECLAEGDIETAWSAAEILAKRMSRRITRRLSVWKSLSPYEREEVEEALIARLYRAWLSREPADEFWEVRFNLSLDRALADEIDRAIRRQSREMRLTPSEDSEMDPWETIPDRRAEAPEEAAIIADALAALQEPMRTTVWLYYRQDWNEEDIAAHLGCTSRTVRNYLRRAKEQLAIWRGTET